MDVAQLVGIVGALLGVVLGLFKLMALGREQGDQHARIAALEKGHDALAKASDDEGKQCSADRRLMSTGLAVLSEQMNSLRADVTRALSERG